jgi:hypothetical protein
MRGLVVRWLTLATRPKLALFEAHRAIESQRVRDALADAASAWLRRRGGLSTSIASSPIDPEGASRLRDDGVVRLPKLLTDQQVDEIVGWLEPHHCGSPYHRARGEFHPDRAPAEVHLGEYDAAVIVRAPHLLALANHPGILAMVEQFLGAKPTISNLSLWWSFPRDAEAKEAQLFHRDVDDLRFCKLFVYLTDVDMDSGPHVFVHGSVLSPACRRIRRYSDSEVTATFGADTIEYMCGKRGEAFIANTGGVHKGLPPSRAKRLLFQAQYSLFPILAYSYQPVAIAASAGVHLDQYVNRLYVA